MKRLKDLKEIRSHLETLQSEASIYSEDMLDYILNLYKITPGYIDKKDLEHENNKYSEYETILFDMFKKTNNNSLTKRYLNYAHKDGYITNTKTYTPIELINKSGEIGCMITKEKYGDSKFLDTYLPNMNKYLYELITMYLLSMRTKQDFIQEVYKNRYSCIAEDIWNYHALDEASKQFLLFDLNKLKIKLLDEKYNSKIHSKEDLLSRCTINEIKDINSYIVATILVGTLIRDDFAFNSKHKELLTTDNTSYNEVLDHLGMNYLKHNDIIKLLQITRDDIHGRKSNK